MAGDAWRQGEENSINTLISRGNKKPHRDHRPGHGRECYPKAGARHPEHSTRASAGQLLPPAGDSGAVGALSGRPRVGLDVAVQSGDGGQLLDVSQVLDGRHAGIVAGSSSDVERARVGCY